MEDEKKLKELAEELRKRAAELRELAK